MAMLRAVVVLAVCAMSDASVNYCGAAMCGKTNAHTFCQFPEGPGPLCSGFVSERLSGEEKARVVARMNRRRSEAAQGKLEQLPAASNMLKLRWVEELAREAQLWADQCRPPIVPEEHDACRDLFAISVGQCVASVVGEAPGLRPESMVDMWYLQGRQFQGAVPVYAEDSKKSPMDFAQMMWAQTYLVGCARSRFMTELDGRLRTVTRLVCNFAPRGPAGPLWAPGAQATDCPPRARPDPELPGLCTFHHDAVFTYDDTNATVLKQQSVLDTILEIERNTSLEYHGSLDQIYLKKIIATNITYEATYESKQNYSTEKQGNVEPVAAEENTDHTSDDIRDVIDDVIAKMVKETSTARVAKKTISMVGRPKPYNIEELNTAVKDLENGTKQPVDTAKEDDGYKDYEFDENLEKNEQDYIVSVMESNVTTALATIFESHEGENQTDNVMATKSPSYSTTTDITNSSIIEMNNATLELADETPNLLVQNELLKRLLELSDKMEKNPSDSETAGQLQDALERMEQALATPVSAKVRRELRSKENRNEAQYPNQNEPAGSRRNLAAGKTRAQELRDISAPDSAPIMSIVSKYAPFIKGYENMFSRNAGESVKTINLDLIILGWLVASGM